jgi:hypothetical protein
MSTPPVPSIRPDDPLRSGRSLLEGVAAGAVYGVLLRGFIVLQTTAQKHFQGDGADPAAFQRHFRLLRYEMIAGEVMTLAFLVLGSIIIGFLTVRRIERRRPASIYTWILAPWLAVFCMMTVIALFAWEGAICVAMALPITLILSSLGGITAGVLGRRMALTASRTACFAILPFLLAPAESMLPSPIQTRTVSTEIRIHASAATIWQNIERVPAISPSELRPSWAHRIGFPRPVEATLSFEGVGGVRHASFEHGLLFIETVTVWEPEHRLAFTIRADSAHIPPTTLDEHVTIGGRYFDVLDGEYSLEPLPNGDTLLHLTSHQRLSTDFNGYAGLWSDAVMQNLQSSILQVVQHRCQQTQ